MMGIKTKYNETLLIMGEVACYLTVYKIIQIRFTFTIFIIKVMLTVTNNKIHIILKWATLQNEYFYFLYSKHILIPVTFVSVKVHITCNRVFLRCGMPFFN